MLGQQQVGIAAFGPVEAVAVVAEPAIAGELQGLVAAGAFEVGHGMDATREGRISLWKRAALSQIIQTIKKGQQRLALFVLPVDGQALRR